MGVLGGSDSVCAVGRYLGTLLSDPPALLSASVWVHNSGVSLGKRHLRKGLTKAHGWEKRDMEARTSLPGQLDAVGRPPPLDIRLLISWVLDVGPCTGDLATIDCLLMWLVRLVPCQCWWLLCTGKA